MKILLRRHYINLGTIYHFARTWKKLVKIALSKQKQKNSGGQIMFLHLGSDTVVALQDVISINDFKSFRSSVNREFIQKMRAKKSD